MAHHPDGEVWIEVMHRDGRTARTIDPKISPKLRVHTDHSEDYLQVEALPDGSIEIRCSEGWLAIEPSSSNRIVVHRYEHDD